LIHGGINYFRARREMKKRLNSDEKEDEESNYQDLPIVKILLDEWKFTISDESIKSVFMQLIIITIVFIFSFSYAGYSKAKEQKEFQYVTSEEETYIVIYNNGADLVIKKAIIDEDNLTVDLSVQKTISVKDVKLYKKSFSTVDIIRTK